MSTTLSHVISPYPIPTHSLRPCLPVHVSLHCRFHYTMLAWLPTYFTSTLSVDLMHAAQTALLPPIAGLIASTVAGRASDHLIASGAPLARVRKMAQTTAFLVPTACLALAAASPCSPDDSTTVVACITAALGMSSFSLAGLYCSHGDLSPKYASALLGLTNVAGSMPGIIGVAVVGALYDTTGDWSSALFLPSAALLLLGAGVYVARGRNAPIDFDAADNSEFELERRLKSWWAVSGAALVSRRAAGVASRTLGQLAVRAQGAASRAVQLAEAVPHAVQGATQRLRQRQ